jgi:Second Messenger Oligonucleotide or Dinucleotide Synthetase domain
MAFTTDAAFERYYENINLSGDFRALAGQRRDHILGLLQNRFTVIDAFAGGSIPKYTALRNHADLDVFVVLHYGIHCKDRRPSQVLLAVRDALAAKPRVRRNGQAVTLTYTSFPDVDVVPVFFTSHDGQRYIDALYLNVPDMNTETWIRSTPKVHSDGIEAAAAAYGSVFRRAIKMMKHWNWRHGDILRSFHIEVLALTAMTGGDFSSIPFAIAKFFDAVSDNMFAPLYYEDGRVDDYLSTADRQSLSARLGPAKASAWQAWLDGFLGNHEVSINIWRSVFGEEFPLYG